MSQRQRLYSYKNNPRSAAYSSYDYLLKKPLIDKQQNKILKQQQVIGQVIDVISQESQGFFGCITCKLFISNDVIVAEPYDLNNFELPVQGQFILCKKITIEKNNILNQNVQRFFYVKILKLNRQLNNNSFRGHTTIDGVENPNLSPILGSGLLNNNQIKSLPYKQGDFLLQSRFGSALKMSYLTIKGEEDQIVSNNPYVTIVNHQLEQHQEGQQEEKVYIEQKEGTFGTKISIYDIPQDKQKKFQTSIQQKIINLKGDVVVVNTGNIVLNSKDQNITLTGNNSITLQSNDKIFVQSQDVKIQGKTLSMQFQQSVKIKVGASVIQIDKNGINISASMIKLNGTIQLPNVVNGSTPGFSSIPICPFTGAPHTTNTV